MLIETLKKRALLARQSRDRITANLLTTVISDASRIGKDDGGREPTDLEVMSVLKKFLGNLNELLATRNDPQAIEERGIILHYLPQPLAGQELHAEVERVAAELGLPMERKSTGQIMKALNEAHPGRINGAEVSRLITESA